MNNINLKFDILYYCCLLAFLYFGLWCALPDTTEIRVLIYIIFFSIFSYQLGIEREKLNHY